MFRERNMRWGAVFGKVCDNFLGFRPMLLALAPRLGRRGMLGTYSKDGHMGSWGFGNFENDDAADWAADLAEMGEAALIDEAFERVLDAKSDFIEAPDASCALAAAEVVAALQGKPGHDLPEELRTWIEGKPSLMGEVLKKAREAVAAVRKESELRDLWEESDGLEDWEPIVTDLERRLA